jgi:putative restriction endonuclease
MPASDAGVPVRRATTVQRIVRSTTVTNQVKELHDHRCQVCGTRIETPAGAYAEGAHIRPLGRPHDGPDVIENVLCLCPTDHVRLDYGAIVIADDLSVRSVISGEPERKLRVSPKHPVSVEHLRYHRQLFEANMSEAEAPPVVDTILDGRN